jgi:hypothetical protein
MNNFSPIQIIPKKPAIMNHIFHDKTNYLILMRYQDTRK